MIKRLIFDVDDTLIPWKDEYWYTLNETLIYYEIEPKDELVNNLKKAVDDYESKYDMYDMDSMRQLMEEYSGIKLPNDFVYRWTLYLEKCVPNKFDVELMDTLDYLKSKYDLVVLTNWFTNQQVKRLKKFGIFKYFIRVLGTDSIKNKPNKEAFLEACKPYKEDECIFIGDSYEVDVKGALQTGLKAIYITNQKEDKDNCIVIDSIYKLKDR